MSKRLRIGILGAARIAAPFTAGAALSERAEVVAVASRDPDRAAAFAREHGVARATTYDELLADPDVDAVYVALPNAAHARWSIAAAAAGKHVLCEKPLATGEAEAEAMFAAADRSGVVLLEGFPYHFQPQTLAIEAALAAGHIGEVRMLQAAFGFSLPDPANIRWDPALAGGALMDAGCYPVSLARLVFGRRPLGVHAVARWQGGVDRDLAATLEYDGGGLAQVSCSFATGQHRHAVIVGTDGAIETDYANHTIRSAAPAYRIKRGGDWTAAFTSIPVPREDGFRAEVDALAAIVDAAARGDRAELDRRRAASVDNAWTLAAILASARQGRPG